MQLIGMLDSPYVRRVAISLQLLGLPFEHRSISVFRTFDITEATGVEFRAEFFNIFNNVNFYGPDNSLTSGNTGRIFAARSPRILQFGLKLLF